MQKIAIIFTSGAFNGGVFHCGYALCLDILTRWKSGKLIKGGISAGCGPALVLSQHHYDEKISIELARALYNASDVVPTIHPKYFSNGMKFKKWASTLLETTNGPQVIDDYDGQLAFIATDYLTGNPIIFGYDTDFQDQAVDQAFQASAALPAFYKVMQLHDVHGTVRYAYDGGVATTLGASCLRAHQDLDLILVSSPSTPLHIQPSHQMTLNNRFAQAYRTSVNRLVTFEQKEFAQMFPDTKLIITRPDQDLRILKWGENYPFRNSDPSGTFIMGFRSAMQTFQQQQDMLRPYFLNNGFSYDIETCSLLLHEMNLHPKKEHLLHIFDALKKS